MARINAKPSAPRQAVYRQRRQAGLQPMAKPWDWLSLADVQKLAVEAYRVATHGLVEDIQAGHLNEQELRQFFAGNLADLMRDLVMAQAVSKGDCWPVGPETPPYRNYPQIAADLCADLPANWRPQYPVYKQLTPASVCVTPGVLTNADEGNVNGIDCKS